MPDAPTLTAEQRAALPAVGETCRSLLPAEVTTTEDGSRSTFTFMTGSLARDGMIVEPDGVDITNYLRNPVVLWSHGMEAAGTVPIGRAENLRRVENGWEADVVWDEEDEFAQRIASKVKRGFIHAVSFGWRTHDAGWETRDGRETWVIRRSEMFEFSPVGVPSDADALVTQRADGAETLEAMVRRIVEEAVREAMPSTVEVEAPEVAITVDGDALARAITAEPVEPPAPEPVAPRAATPDDYAALAVQIAHAARAAKNTATQRALGRA
jgi:HK97 family phage prohead protease